MTKLSLNPGENTIISFTFNDDFGGGETNRHLVIRHDKDGKLQVTLVELNAYPEAHGNTKTTLLFSDEEPVKIVPIVKYSREWYLNEIRRITDMPSLQEADNLSLTSYLRLRIKNDFDYEISESTTSVEMYWLLDKFEAHAIPVNAYIAADEWVLGQLLRITKLDKNRIQLGDTFTNLGFGPIAGDDEKWEDLEEAAVMNFGEEFVDLQAWPKEYKTVASFRNHIASLIARPAASLGDIEDDDNDLDEDSDLDEDDEPDTLRSIIDDHHNKPLVNPTDSKIPEGANLGDEMNKALKQDAKKTDKPQRRRSFLSTILRG